ncbi:methyltransferase domain-containing protein [Pontibacterium sp. N1Y112]|uniref:Methyltransferase domain-containing protein n=1 Tax=Pontibacterium sinense TaxID=2781979 RepID=A0A8J7FH45_9GAMM|nr:methyltransferase domain-containing protein [Pontibacterium sinense]
MNEDKIMLKRNNPNIDFDALNARIAEQLTHYQHNTAIPPEFAVETRSSAPAVSTTAPITSITELLSLEDKEFVSEAYKLLLGRPSDNDGLNHYLGLLRSGEEKSHIINSLAFSAEGKKNAHLVPGRTKQLIKRVILKLPVISKVSATLFSTLSAPQFRRYIQARFNHFYRLGEDHNARLNNVDSTFAAHAQQLDTQQEAIAALQELVSQQAADNLASFSAQQEMLIENNEFLTLQQTALTEHKDHLTAQKETLTEHNEFLTLQQEALAEHKDALTHQKETIASQSTIISQLNNEATTQKKYIEQLKLRINTLENLKAAAPNPEKQRTVSPISQSAEIEDAFYVAFESHFRGSTETITSRLQYYVPLIQKNPTLKACSLPSVDIGCGRGEWLNVLREEGLEPLGIDLNSVNVALCSEAGHNALKTDGLSWLQDQPDNSLALISSFHVIEHLTFEQFNHLLTQAIRTLVPGGMLILETPNPENLITGATHFYTDPTHLHPLPPAFTEFTVTYKGFTDVTIHRLNAIPEEFCIPQNSTTAERCNTLFYGPQDYAVTAVKPFLDN